LRFMLPPCDHDPNGSGNVRRSSPGRSLTPSACGSPAPPRIVKIDEIGGQPAARIHQDW
jgi:hypothetical protein